VCYQPFLFAAKSITRYKKVSEERNFPEYYLIGTLLSIIWALAIGLGRKGFLLRVLASDASSAKRLMAGAAPGAVC